MKKIIITTIVSLAVMTSFAAGSNNDIELMNAALVAPNGYAYFLKGKFCHQYNIRSDYLKAIREIGSDAFKGLPTNVDAALMHPHNGKGYIFKGNSYYRFNFKDGKVDKTGVVGQDGWKGLNGPFDAAISHPTNNCAYFFRGTKYYRYSYTKKRIDKVGTIGSDGWKGLGSNLDVALMHTNGKAYFFKDDHYYRYDFTKQKVDKYGMIGKDGWKGLFEGIDASISERFLRDNYCYNIKKVTKSPLGFMHLFATTSNEVERNTIGYQIYQGVPRNVEAALTHPKNKRIYFFKGDKYYRFDTIKEKVDKIGTIGKDGWIGVPTYLDAAVVHSNGKAYFFKGKRYYRYDFTTHKVDKVALIKQNWQGVPDNIDAVMDNEGTLLVYKKSVEYVYDPTRRKVVKWNLITDEILR